MSPKNTRFEKPRTDEHFARPMECAVCYERVCGPLKLACKHTFCRKCIEEWYVTSEAPSCPSCRRPIKNKSLDEVRNKRQEDNLFGDVLDQYLEDWCEFVKEGPVSTWDHRLFLEDLSNVQQTIKVLKECALDNEEILEFVDFEEWQTWKPFPPRGWIAWDPPSQKFFNEYIRVVPGWIIVQP
jgi:hypothetical protein